MAYRQPSTPAWGYDIISNHPIFNGAAIGRAAETDFRLFAGSVENLNGGVVLNVGSAIMGPQVFEKTLSCVNNVRLQDGQAAIAGHSIYVVDNSGWRQLGLDPRESRRSNTPPTTCGSVKATRAMGGTMRYVQADNVQFMHHLWHRLKTC